MNTYSHRLRQYLSNGNTQLFPIPDILLVVTLAFASLLIEGGWDIGHSLWLAPLAGAVNLLTVVPLLLRRTNPMLMLWLMLAAGIGQLLVNDAPSASLIAVPIAAYSIARWADSKQSWIVLGIGLIASILSSLNWSVPANSPYFISSFSLHFLTCYAAVVLPYLLGRRLLKNCQ